MTALSNISPHAMLPLAAYDEASLRRAATLADQRTLSVDLGGLLDREAVFAAIGQAFELPAYFGGNLDALYDCLTDLVAPPADAPGFLVMLRDLPDTSGFGRNERDALLDVFREAADYFFEQDVAFRVFYSVAKPVADDGTSSAVSGAAASGPRNETPR